MAGSMKQREAFEVYFRLGGPRSIERLAAELVRTRGRAPSLRTLYGWSSRHQWQNQLARLDHEASVVEDEVRVAELKKMFERQAKAGLLMQEKGMAWLVAIEGETAGAEAAIRAIVEGAKLERLSRGEAGERQEVIGGIETRLGFIEDTELEALLRIAESAMEGDGEATAE